MWVLRRVSQALAAAYDEIAMAEARSSVRDTAVNVHPRFRGHSYQALLSRTTYAPTSR